MRTRTVDLCTETASRVQSAAFYALRDIAPGTCVVLLTAQDPALMMRSLDLQLGHRLAWTVTPEGARWRVEVRHRADSAPRDVFDMLLREHQRFDRLLAEILRLLNAGDAVGAAPLVAQFSRMLARHVEVEDRVLVPFFGSDSRADEPAAVMVREHADVAAQLAVIEACFGEGTPDAGEASAFAAILAATLAKHEHREENNLFPLWRARWAQKTPAEREEMMRRVEAVLAGAAEGRRQKDEG